MFKSLTKGIKSVVARAKRGNDKDESLLGIPEELRGDASEIRRIMDIMEAQFDPEYYLSKYGDIRESNVNPYKHYITYGWREGRQPAPWFHTERYMENHQELISREVNPFFHYIHHNQESITARENLDSKVAHSTRVDANIPKTTKLNDLGEIFVRVAVPSREDFIVAGAAFDEEYYIEQNSDVAEWGGDPLLHFLTIGWLEGRDPSPDFSLGYYIRNNSDMRNLRQNPFLHYLRNGHKEKWRKTASVSDAKILDFFNQNEKMKRRVQQACDLDPMVALPLEPRKITSPVKSVLEWANVVKEVRQCFEGQSYSYVILVPHIRMSGSARVASILTRMLAEIVDYSSILILTTDSAEDEYSDWFPTNIRRECIFDYIRNLDQMAKVGSLFDLLRGIECETLINVNSQLFWEAMRIYGRQLSQEFRVVTYLFTWDETVSGARVGYPIQWLRDTADHHDIILTDNEALSRDIRERFGFDKVKGGASVHTLYTPIELLKSEPVESVEVDKEKSSIEETEYVPSQNVGDHEKIRVLWAGRFDRQKRVDVLVEIARDNPNIQFDVYGKKVLDKFDLSDFSPPDNIVAKGVYQDLAEVLETPYSAFLYTSQWDGIPTILLDIGQVGLPIVASNVGGVSELIDEDTGWLVENIEDPSEYSAALRDILDLPEVANNRARALQAKIATKFSQVCYLSALEEVLTENED